MAASLQVSFTRREWELVTEYYRSDDISKLKEAVAIIAIWRARMGNNLHVAAEMTELLLRAIILDKETDANDWFNVGYMRIVYSTAIIRIINYANELSKDKIALPQTVAESVSKLGIPNWVVQIRHAAAHQFFPSIQAFRQAAQFCRDWLWDMHWGKPVIEAMNLTMEKATITPCERAVDLIVSYITIRMSLPKKGNSENELQGSRIMNDLYAFVETDASNFVRAFLFDGHLIMTDEQVAIAGFNVDDGNEIWLIPPNLQLFWEPVFKILSQLNAFPELLCQLISNLSYSKLKKCQERQYAAWIDYMLTAFSDIDTISQFDWKRIMKEMLSSHVSFRREHYKVIMSKINLLSAKKRKQLQRLLNLSLDTSATAESDLSYDGGYEIKTLEDLRELIETGAGEVDAADPVTGEENWIACDPAVWRGVPLGLTPEQTTESLFLILDKDSL